MEDQEKTPKQTQEEFNEYYDKINGVEALRQCLRCDRMFKSLNKSNRICGKCRKRK